MAWVAKNSAGTEIQRREEPYVDDAFKAMLEAEVLPKYPTRQAATLPALHAIQHQYNWISYQAIEELAEFLELDSAVVLDTASFYEDFWLKPKGKYLIMLCQSITCELMGQKELLAGIEAKLGIKAGETTEDEKFTLIHAECLGSCDTGPTALVNEVLHERLTIDNFSSLLDSLE